jgi:zinc protease
MKRRFATILLGVLIMGSTQARADIVPQTFHTKQGIEVWLEERHSLPFVVIKVLVKAGSVYDSDEKAGLAYLTSQLIPEGTSEMTGPQISQELDFMGSELGSDCSKEYATLVLITLKEHLKKSFEILGQVIAHPAFRDEDFGRVKKEVLGEILKEEEDPGAVASKTFNEKIFAGHPYHKPVKGYSKTIEKLTRQDVLDFYHLFYRPNFSIISVAGDVTRQEMENLIHRYLEDWTPTKEQLPLIPDPTPLSKAEKVEVDKDVTQANVVIGHLGAKRANPDFASIYVMNQILGGGGLTSRLFKEIREERGYSYSVYSLFQPSYWRGAFRVVLQTKNDKAEAAVNEVIKVLKDYVKVGPSPQELESAKKYLTGSFPLRLDTNQEIADYMAFAAFHHLGKDYFVRFPQEIEAVTLKDVKRVAKEYIHPDKLLVVVVKKPSSP